MSGKVKLEIIEGPMRGNKFLFEEHDTFLFGRMADCHACLADDPKVSRHHFIMEANPPDARIRDLGSLNGTYVGNVRYGGREIHETPEEAVRRKFPEVDLKEGDLIRVGDTIIKVGMEIPAICCECGHDIADYDREKCAWIGDTYICTVCKQKLLASKEQPKAPEPVRCQKCGQNVSQEVGRARRGAYICQSCRKEAVADPLGILLELLRQARKVPSPEKTPEIKGYEIEKRLGAGGFGAVYLARRKKDNERVAVKVMLSRVAVDENDRKKFLREIDAMKALRHKNVVSLLESGSAGSAFYFIMEFCDGGSADNLMRRRGGRLRLEEAGKIILQSLEGLAYAHKKNIVHRDLKPANILLQGSEGSWLAKICDVGLGKNFQRAGFSGMTVTGAVAGTPPFMPREQVTNFKYVKPVSDVWSMGATFYNLLTGQFPRDFERGRDYMEIILHESIVPVYRRDSSIPKKIAEVIDCALDDNIKNRYQTAEEFRRALEKAL
jgi:DNA-directed RNA polymerase subunit RPC12/RpoP